MDAFEGEPRIAWYPSCGTDFRALVYLHPSFSKRNPTIKPEPLLPDIFLYTDDYPWEDSTFLDNPVVYSDDRTTVVVESIEQLPQLNLPLHKDIVDFPNGSNATGQALFLRLRIESKKFGTINFPVYMPLLKMKRFIVGR